MFRDCCIYFQAIFGGHISGRRLRGVKVNPIYQDNDSGRSGCATHPQCDSSVPVGEIQIEMYESLPRYRVFQPRELAPNVPQTCPLGSSRVPYVWTGREARLGGVEREDRSQHFSELSLPKMNRCDGAIYTENENPTASNRRSSFHDDGNEKHTDPKPYPETESKYKKDGTPRSATEDAPDPKVSKTVSPSTSCSSSSVRPSHASSVSQVSRVKRRPTPRLHKSKKVILKRQLSDVPEQNSLSDNEEEMDDTELVSDDETDNYDDSVVPGHDDGDCSENFTDNYDEETLSVSDEMCHTVSYTGGEDSGLDKLFSANNGNTNLINNIINSRDLSFDMDNFTRSPNKEILVLLLSKSMLSLDNITELFSCSEMECCKINKEIVPYLMLDYNRQEIKGISKHGPENDMFAHKQSSGLGENIWPNSNTLCTEFSSTNAHNSFQEIASLLTDCQCDTRSNLKCCCGHEVLHMLQRNENGILPDEEFWKLFGTCFSKDTTLVQCTEEFCETLGQTQKLQSERSKFSNSNLVLSSVTDTPCQKHVEQNPQPVCPDFRDTLLPKEGALSVECRTQTTLFQGANFEEVRNSGPFNEGIDFYAHLNEDSAHVNRPFQKVNEEDQVCDKGVAKELVRQTNPRTKDEADDCLILKVNVNTMSLRN